MKYRFRSIPLALVAALSLSACKPSLSNEPYSKGPLDFSNYIAVGNSLTAGYADGTLYRSGQQAAYPAILSSVFNQFGPSPYRVPLLPGNAGWPSPKRVLEMKVNCAGVESLTPVFYSGSFDTAGSATSVAAQGPYTNLGVPGIRAIDYLFPGYPALNPYSSRFFSDLSSTPLAELSRIRPSFFTMWIGNNDVLGYATSGGDGKSANGSFFDLNSISHPILFKAAVDSVLGRLMPSGSNAQGAVINIPDVTAIPFFTTVRYDGLEITRQGELDSLNFLYAPTGISFSMGKNPFIIQDNSLPPLRYRKARAGEYILLNVPQDSLSCAGWGGRKAIPSQYVLDANEVQAIKEATAMFNGILKTAAYSRGLAYVDINSYLSSISSGILYNGITLNAEYVKGGAFSLDGVHLTPRGNALVTNEIIRTINFHYGTSLPTVDINAYNGVIFP